MTFTVRTVTSFGELLALLCRGTREAEIPVLRDEISRLTGHVCYNTSVKRQRDAATVKLRRNHFDSGILRHKGLREAMACKSSQVVLLDSEGWVEELPEFPKEEVAEWKADWVEGRMHDGIRGNRRGQ